MIVEHYHVETKSIREQCGVSEEEKGEGRGGDSDIEMGEKWGERSGRLLDEGRERNLAALYLPETCARTRSFSDSTQFTLTSHNTDKLS